MKGTNDGKQEKSTTKSVADDDDGQGKLYSPEFAIKINTGNQQDSHVRLLIYPTFVCFSSGVSY